MLGGRWKAEAAAIFRLLPKDIGNVKHGYLQTCREIVNSKYLPANKYVIIKHSRSPC